MEEVLMALPIFELRDLEREAEMAFRRSKTVKDLVVNEAAWRALEAVYLKRSRESNRRSVMNNRDMVAQIALRLDANVICISLPAFMWDENGPNGVFQTHNSMFKMQNERVEVRPSIEVD